MSAARTSPDHVGAPANDTGLSDRDLERLADLLAPRLAALLGSRSISAQLVTKGELGALWRVSGATIDRMVRAGDACRAGHRRCTPLQPGRLRRVAQRPPGRRRLPLRPQSLMR